MVALQEDFGFPLGAAGGDFEQTVSPYVTSLVGFRDEVRAAAKAAKANDLLALCDNLRDFKMVDLGVKLEDKDGGAEWALGGAFLRLQLRATLFFFCRTMRLQPA